MPHFNFHVERTTINFDHTSIEITADTNEQAEKMLMEYLKEHNPYFDWLIERPPQELHSIKRI